MSADRKQHGPAVAPGETDRAVAPGEPEAPVSGSVPEPAAPPADEPDSGASGRGVPEAGDRGASEGGDRGASEGGDPDASQGGGEPQPEGGPAPDHEPRPQAAPEPDHEHQLERDLEELTAKAEKADEYLELAQRTKADFENYRKRASRETAAAQERGVTKLLRELLPAVDNLDRALEAAEADPEGNGSGDTLISGIKLVHADVVAALGRCGIERFSPQGERFDPQEHEAVAQQPVEGAEPGTVVEVYQRGYRLGENVIRPARVVVAG
jgi:molecular chaperone GrpE